MDEIIFLQENQSLPIRLPIWIASFRLNLKTDYVIDISPVDVCRARIRIEQSHSHDARRYDPLLRCECRIDLTNIWWTSRCILYASLEIPFPMVSLAPSVCVRSREKISADRSQSCFFCYRFLFSLTVEVMQYQVSRDSRNL